VLTAGDWTGGRNYLKNLFSAMRSLPEADFSPVLVVGEKQAEGLVDFPGVEVVTTSLLDRKSLAWFGRKLISKTTSRDVLLQAFLRKRDIPLLSHCLDLGRPGLIKTIGWIPDFQHVFLPQFFAPEELAYRDREFKRICENSDKVIVSSKCAHADLVAFSPQHAHKAELLRFVVNPASFDNATELPQLERTYDFNGPYFLLPNQFWIHKNHRVVISALQKLKRHNNNLLVLATGSTNDARHPTFFGSLMQFAAECGVLDTFRVLGKIPASDLAGLARHTTAIINPSRFEGWSTSVEEAKSLGKQVVLSDIPVHREQEPERGLFFRPDEPDGLVEAMITAYRQFDQREDDVLRIAARANFLQRQRDFAKEYLGILNRVTRIGAIEAFG
jgi:glycosyltransferase involved in cell wall biosynthesis